VRLNLLVHATLLAIVVSPPLTCADADQVQEELQASVIRVQPGPSAQYELQSALINAVPGDVIELGAGKFQFTSELNITCDNLTIRGQGSDSTVLSFRGQLAGSSGIIATGNAFVIENLAVEDTSGNAIKTLGARDVTFRSVRVEWTDGPKTTNGAYGIYPVECQNVLIDDCQSIGASDAGIYVGQSQDVIVRNCTATKNVAGIEIENTLRADVYDNRVFDNTGGILVFDLPGLNLTNGGDVRVFHNDVRNNNLENFASPGTMVADVPSGAGMMLMATDRVEIFDNDIHNHQTSNVLVVSFLVTERKVNDKKYDPYPEAFSIHDNRMSGAGSQPAGQLGVLLSPVVGLPFPDIFFDGIVDQSKLTDGRYAAEYQSGIINNGDATFANVHLADFSPTNLLTGKYSIDRDLTPWQRSLAQLPEVTLQPHAAPSVNGNPAVAVYRAAPEKLSGWNVFESSIDALTVGRDWIPYELNTPLFSDYTNKLRLIGLPEGAAMHWTSEQALEFPVGTVIAKTFSYPDQLLDPTPGERYIETRIELLEESGWYGFSYVWNDEQTDATLRLGGAAMDVSWTDASGREHHNHYQIPNANQCISCHGQDGKFVPLGPTAANLNRRYAATDEQDQLTAWAAHGHLTGIPSVQSRPELPRYDDPHSGTVAARARAWMDVNCAHCHNPLGSARTSGLDLRITQSDPARYGVYKSPVAAGSGSGGRRYDIVPGKPDESILMFRLESEEPGARMPNLARNLIHQESNDLIREWILQMQDPQSAAGD